MIFENRESTFDEQEREFYSISFQSMRSLKIIELNLSTFKRQHLIFFPSVLFAVCITLCT